jgi:predicted metalloprotease with PDZ domain
VKRVGSRAIFFILVVLFVSPLVAQRAGSAEHGRSGHAFIYTVVPADPSRHLLRIRLKLDPQPETKFQLPVWNALYQVRDFSQFLRSITARDAAGHALPVQTIDKTTWTVANASEVEYEVVADTPGPFGAQLTETHAFLNLAQLLMYPVGWQHDWSCVISFDGLPPGWRVATSMIRFPDDTTTLPNSYMAVNYDALADSPVEMGTFQESEFEEGRTKYRVLVDANPSDYDMKAVVDMGRKLAATEIEWMRDRPIDHYLFIFHFPRRPAGGGMEHAYSTAIDAPAERVKSDPLSLADITAHEFFHLWNVKRIRPQSLEPVDYTKEQYTRALWFSEGVTSTVADFIRVRAGYLDERGFLAELAADIRNLEARPARLTQSAEESSLEAWLEKYPAYESPQRSVSYYNKGEILGILLDLQMREASAGKKSLRDLFHWMNEHYAKQEKFFDDSRGVQEAAEAVTGADFGGFFAHYVAGTDALPYDKLFATVGLRLDKQTVTLPDPGFRTMRRQPNAPVVVAVEPGSEAEKAGLRAGDTIQRIQGNAPGAIPENDLMIARIGDTVDVRVVGVGGSRRLKFKLAGKLAENYALVESESVTPARRARRAAWMRGESE